ncbi:MAG TPA: hypothetical protein VGH08_10390 [Chthoniobacterales bacterium]
MNRDDDPELWDLLGQAEEVEPSPFFARSVLRALRRDQPEKRGFAGWIAWRKIVPTLSAVAAILLAFGAIQTFHKSSTPSRRDRILLANGQDPDFAADLDVLANLDDDSDDSALL